MQRRTLEVRQRWQSKPSNSTALIWAIVHKGVERLPVKIGGFANLQNRTPAPVRVAEYR